MHDLETGWLLIGRMHPQILELSNDLVCIEIYQFVSFRFELIHGYSKDDFGWCVRSEQV